MVVFVATFFAMVQSLPPYPWSCTYDYICNDYDIYITYNIKVLANTNDRV